MAVLRVPAVMDNLHEVQAFVVQCARELGAPEDLALKLELALEELAVNVISYAYGKGKGDLEVTCLESELDGARALSVTLRDWGAPFDPLQKESPDTEMAMEDRPIGGLGIHLVLQMADGAAYAHESGCNALTVTYKLETDGERP